MNKKRFIRLFLGAILICIAFFIGVYEHFFESVPEDGLGLPRVASLSPVVSCDPELEEKLMSEEPLHIRKGDTLSHVLKCANIPSAQVHSIIKALKSNFNPKDLKPQHALVITTAPSEEKGMREVLTLSIRPNFREEIIIVQQEDGSYKSEKKNRQIKQETRVAQGTIQSSLYIDAGKHGVPNKILHELIRVFSYQVDFQRNVKPGDCFELMYDIFVDEENEAALAGELLYASLKIGQSTLYIYRHKHKNGDTAFYNEKGESIKKAILQTPVDGARITSKFGNRKDPFKGYTKMHRGLDFGVPSRTPVMAAGNGIVEQAGWFGGYGKYVRLRHANNFKTAYAHLSSFARGLHVGKTVKQGQVIAYSGSTGRSTAPHLHYEVLKGNQQINPQLVKKIPGTSRLNGEEFRRFQSHKTGADKLYLALLTAPPPIPMEKKEREGPYFAEATQDQKARDNPQSVKMGS